MRLRYNISLKSQVMYVHGHHPEFLWVELEGGFPQLWVECDEKQHQYPRRFDVHNTELGPYIGQGKLIPSRDTAPWEFYDAGPGTTAEFDAARWPNKAPMPLNGEKNPYENMS